MLVVLQAMSTRAGAVVDSDGQRIVAFILAHPGLGPRRIAATLAEQRWGGLSLSPHGVWRVLRRHALNRLVPLLSLVTGCRPSRPGRLTGRPALRARASYWPSAGPTWIWTRVRSPSGTPFDVALGR